MELQDLAGEHILDAVDTSVEQVPYWGGGYENANCIVFRLDDTPYIAIEDPSDGYRSSMREIKAVDRAMANVFPPVRVVGVHRTLSDYYSSADLLELIDIKTGRTVLTVGTDNNGDYYPSFVASFLPENMATNNEE